MILRKYLKDIVDNKTMIIHNWVNNEKVANIFYTHNIETDAFLKDSASALIDYYIQLIDSDLTDENCADMDDLLHLFEIKKIKYHELFILCKIFKKSFSNYFIKNNNLPSQLEKEIFLIFDLSYKLIEYLLREAANKF